MTATNIDKNNQETFLSLPKFFDKFRLEIKILLFFIDSSFETRACKQLLVIIFETMTKFLILAVLAGENLGAFYISEAY